MALLISGAAALVAPRALAQTSTGSVRGYVTDSSGAPLEGARVIAVSVLTSAQREATAQARGFYALTGLVPGEYDLTARHIGRAPQKVRVRVLIGEVFPLDFRLAASAIEVEAVTVAVAGGVETRTSEVATNVTPQQIQQLPSPSRNFLDLAALAPGITITEDRANLGANNITPRTFSAGAQGPAEVNVFVDGASLKNDLTGGNGQSGVSGQDASRGNPFPRNAIQEYRVITQNFKAEYQKASSAIITATTKSGGNVWSGDAFFSYQNQDLVAVDPFLFPNGQNPDYSRYLGGFSIGGPLVQDRLRFFGSYEGNYQNRTQSVSMPTGPSGFAAIDALSLAQYNGNFQSPFRESLLFGKLSYTVNDHSSADLSFNDRIESDVRDFGQLTAFQSATQFRNDVRLGTLKYNYSTGPWLSEATVTYENFRRNPTPDIPGVPHQTYFFGCCIDLGSHVSSQDFTQKRLGLRDDVTYAGWHAGGDHVLKAGVDVDFLTYNVTKQNYQTPQFYYADSVNCNPTCTGNEGYTFRVPYAMVWATGNPFLNAHNTQLGAYLQDDWSPSSRLTINLGIRWDFESHMLNYDYVTPADVRATIDTYYTTLLIPIDTTEYFSNGTQRHKFYGAFQPRLGFSYALDGDGKTTLFGGFGIFYDRSFFDVSVDETLKQTYPQYTVHFADPDSTPKTGQTAWNNSYLTTDPAVLTPLATSGQAAGREDWLIANHAKVPKSNEWSVGIRRLFGVALVSAAYVGVRSYDQLVLNFANLTLKSNGDCCNGGGFGHGFSNIIYSTNTGRTWYDALQVQVTRPYLRTGKLGWGGGLSYTYATRSVQGIDQPDDEIAFTQSSIIPKHPANDEKSRLVANWTLDVPYAFGVQFGGLITLGSGQLIASGCDRALPGCAYNPAAFSPPKYGFIIPGAWRYRDVDLRLRKEFPSVSGTTVGVTVDLFNTFNFKNYGCYNTGNGQAGCLVTDPRRLQLGAEYTF